MIQDTCDNWDTDYNSANIASHALESDLQGRTMTF